jgi:hypothetical protein
MKQQYPKQQRRQSQDWKREKLQARRFVQRQNHAHRQNQAQQQQGQADAQGWADFDRLATLKEQVFGACADAPPSCQVRSNWDMRVPAGGATSRREVNF